MMQTVAGKMPPPRSVSSRIEDWRIQNRSASLINSYRARCEQMFSVWRTDSFAIDGDVIYLISAAIPVC